MANANRICVSTDKAPQPVGAYSQAVRATPGELLFIAGQVSVNMNGDVIGKGDVAAQTRQVFANLGGVLEGVGASFSDVVEFTTYLVGRDAIPHYLDARKDLYPTIYPDGDFPANTLLVIDSLFSEDFLVEIKAVAVLP